MAEVQQQGPFDVLQDLILVMAKNRAAVEAYKAVMQFQQNLQLERSKLLDHIKPALADPGASLPRSLLRTQNQLNKINNQLDAVLYEAVDVSSYLVVTMSKTAARLTYSFEKDKGCGYGGNTCGYTHGVKAHFQNGRWGDCIQGRCPERDREHPQERRRQIFFHKNALLF